MQGLELFLEFVFPADFLAQFVHLAGCRRGAGRQVVADGLEQGFLSCVVEGGEEQGGMGRVGAVPEAAPIRSLGAGGQFEA